MQKCYQGSHTHAHTHTHTHTCASLTHTHRGTHVHTLTHTYLHNFKPSYLLNNVWQLLCYICGLMNLLNADASANLQDYNILSAWVAVTNLNYFASSVHSFAVFAAFKTSPAQDHHGIHCWI